MTTSADLLFLTCIAWIFAHELDAIQQHEWRVLPLTSWMNDRLGYPTFVLLHIPLVVAIILAIPSRNFQIGMDVFLIIHAGLHIVFRKHPSYTFNNWLSWLLIFGVVPLAMLHLLMLAT